MNRCSGLTYQAKQAAKKAFERERIAAAAKRTPMQQLRRLDERLGKNMGAHKERERLEWIIEGWGSCIRT